LHNEQQLQMSVLSVTFFYKDIISTSLYIESGNHRPVRYSGLLQHTPLEAEMEAEKPATDQAISHRVYVVYGHNLAVRDAMYAFLEDLDLQPVTKEAAVNWSGEASPFADRIIDAAFNHAQAVIVLFTGDDRARRRSSLRKRNEEADGKTFWFQPRQDQTFEAGYAFGRSPERTILIQVGRVRLFSDIDGRYIPNFTGRESERRDLINRLKNAGCLVNDNGDAWRSAGNFTPPQKKSK
jgi:predicted nucleotide-binding protein